MNALLAALLFVAAVAQPAYAESPSNKGPQGASAMQAARLTATVEAVDPQSRVVTLKGSDGDITSIRVHDEVRNLDRLAAGDVVEVDYYEAVAIQIKSTDAEPTATESTSVKRSQPGEKPGGMVKRKVRVVSEVVGVNPESQTMLVRGPQGNLARVRVKDPARLAEFQAGGKVDITYIESLAIAIRTPQAK